MIDITSNASKTFKGPLIAAASASFFALNTPVATFVYAAGGNSITLVFVRLVAIVLFTVILAILLKRIPKVERKNLPGLLFFSICVFGQGFCYLSSVAYIPVSLAALLLYTWPIMAAIASPLIGEDRATKLQMICFLSAFVGLAITFGPSLDELDPRGVIFAILAAFFTVGLILSCSVIQRKTDTLSVAFYGNLFSALLAAIFLPMMGGFVLPSTQEGLYALGFICMVYPAAIATQLLALRITKASVAAMIYNMEPVVSIIVALILLGEILTPPQYLGGAIVIGALIVFSRPQTKIKM